VVVKNKQVELLENSGVKVSVEVSKEAIQQEYDELVAEYCKTVRVDGFRRGKVPPGVLVRKFGDALLGETAERVIRKSVEELLDQVEQKPIATSVPEIDAKQSLELGKDFAYTVSWDTVPAVELGEYKGLEFEELQAQIGDEDMERELKNLQEQNSIVVDKKDATVLKGDILSIDYAEQDAQGVDIPGSRREGFVFEVGSGYNLYKIDEQLVGMKAGEEKLISKEYPADFEYKELAGRTVSLKVKVNAVKEKQIPELNDELAQDISDKYQTLEDLKKDIRARLEDYARRRVREHSISQILERVIEGAKIALPRSMVEHELADQWQSFLSRVAPRAGEANNEPDETPVLRQLEKDGKSKQDVLNEWRPGAEKKLKLQLAVSEMVKREGIELEDQELDSRVQQAAEAENISFEEAKQAMTRNRYLDFLRFDLKNEKLYDLLLEGGTRKKGKEVKFLDLVQGNY
jgi:trigger factor